MKSLVELLVVLLHSCSRLSGTNLARDVQTVRARVEHEGDCFITITLPNFCRDFERSLADGRISPGQFAAFGRLKSGIPAFLQGLLSDVFDDSGTLRAQPSIACIRLVRQICLFGKKIGRPCSDARNSDAIKRFVACDSEVAIPEEGQLMRYFERVGDVIVSSLRLDDEDDLLVMTPKHGPGATVEHFTGANQKWAFTEWTDRLSDAGFTPALYSGRPESDLADCPPFSLDPGSEKPVRVTLVPKTQKTPRIIAVEPLRMQFAQQGLKRLLVGRIEESDLTSGHINFIDRTVNQRLALRASRDGLNATLDMSEASDRVSCDLVERLFRSAPNFRALLLAARSTRARLPDRSEISLRKFASMGSATCFPVEALVFYTSIIASRLLRAGRFPSEAAILSSGSSVYVYGDDLIFPSDEVPATSVDLEALGFKVNRQKSFWTGQFRESCGSDCYGGEEVAPVYLRQDLPKSREDVSALLSSVATANQLYQAGYVEVAAAIKEAVEALPGIARFPQADADSAAIGWAFYSEEEPRRRWNRALQRQEWYCWTSHTPAQLDGLDGYPALAKSLAHVGSTCWPPKKGWQLPAIVPDHLVTSPRAYALTLKRRWLPVGAGRT